MSSILKQNPDATVAEALEGIPEDLITRRENLRIRALIGSVPVNLLAESDTAGLAAVIGGEPDGTLADPTVMCGFTMPMSPKRIPVIAAFFLDYLHNGLPVREEPKLPPVPVAPAPTSKSRGGKDRTKPPLRGVPITLEDLRAERRPGGSRGAPGSTGANHNNTTRGRPAGSPADMARARRGIQE